MIFSVLEKNTLTCCTFLCLDTIPQIFLLFCNRYRLNITNYKDNFTYAFSRTWKTYKFVLFFLMKSYFTYTFQSVWKSIIDVLHLIIKYKFTHIFFCILTKKTTSMCHPYSSHSSSNWSPIQHSHRIYECFRHIFAPWLWDLRKFKQVPFAHCQTKFENKYTFRVKSSHTRWILETCFWRLTCPRFDK